ncbi:MAG: septum site-determining protein MinC [Thiohalocapsa sp.]|uniref:septum site-determining protein MinC n=1 Tax=Thiohalocapsa sp. TaxID=2497641 RepID=UPI0025FEA53C|nr:septum site-determining protein MinC [Thiohalocapsa sp.]MCG6943491.1 septum site-determining protein MinC [Thiohalocapsa sp.]
MAVQIPTEGATAAAPAFELKASSFTLPVIRLLSLDMDTVETQLEAKVDQAPGFFRNTPVVIDLSELAQEKGNVGFPHLVGLLRGLGMIPVGVRGGGAAQNDAARAMELAILGDNGRSGRQHAEAPQQSGAEPPMGDTHGDHPPVSVLVDRPVRSGQRLYAAGGDLTIVGPVSSGAELMADGNIHVYGPLRGRVIAGLKGDIGARIFCRSLEAELVSVAGHYRVSENIPTDLKRRSVQVFLDHEVLRIEPLG